MILYLRDYQLMTIPKTLRFTSHVGFDPPRSDRRCQRARTDEEGEATGAFPEG